jgi:hypothetical protein
MTGFHEKSTGDYQANLDTFRLLLPVWARKDYIVPEPNVNVPNLGAFFDLANRIIALQRHFIQPSVSRRFRCDR